MNLSTRAQRGFRVAYVCRRLGYRCSNFWSLSREPRVLLIQRFDKKAPPSVEHGKPPQILEGPHVYLRYLAQPRTKEYSDPKHNTPQPKH